MLSNKSALSTCPITVYYENNFLLQYHSDDWIKCAHNRVCESDKIGSITPSIIFSSNLAEIAWTLRKMEMECEKKTNACVRPFCPQHFRQQQQMIIMNQIVSSGSNKGINFSAKSLLIFKYFQNILIDILQSVGKIVNKGQITELENHYIICTKAVQQTNGTIVKSILSLAWLRFAFQSLR